MNEVGLGELFVRMIISLAIVLGIVLGAYAIVKRRRGTGSGAGRSMVPRTGKPRSGGNGRSGLRVLGRTGVARQSSVVAIQFADRVLLIGGNDQAAPNLIAEIALEDWERATQAPPDPLSGVTVPTTTPAPSGLIDALRQATTRRG